jgi:cytoskeletal protein CcmA (bactofilin family)
MDSASLIARGARVLGGIETPGHVVVEGRIEGPIRAGGDVTVARGAVALGEIRAWRARIEGVVIGNVIARERVELADGGRIVGDLCAPVVEVEPGGEIEGKIDRRVPDADERPSEPRAALRPVGTKVRRPLPPLAPSGASEARQANGASEARQANGASEAREASEASEPRGHRDAPRADADDPSDPGAETIPGAPRPWALPQARDPLLAAHADDTDAVASSEAAREPHLGRVVPRAPRPGARPLVRRRERNQEDS